MIGTCELCMVCVCVNRTFWIRIQKLTLSGQSINNWASFCICIPWTSVPGYHYHDCLASKQLLPFSMLSKTCIGDTPWYQFDTSFTCPWYKLLLQVRSLMTRVFIINLKLKYIPLRSSKWTSIRIILDKC